jgi:hypothetical protein
MEADDRLHHPMTFVIELRLSGRIDREAFQTALSDALLRHPFLRALVQRRKKNQLCWVSGGGLGPRVDWSDDDRPIELPAEGEPIDLDSEVGLRVWVRRLRDESKLTLQFHHACCDGVGAYRFIGDLLAIYGGLTAADGAALPSLDPLDVTRLRTRSRGVLDEALSGRNFRLARRAIPQGLEILSARPTEMATARKETGARLSPFPSIHSVTFERAAHDQLRDAAMREGAMLNDLLLAELFLSLRDWNVRRTGSAGRKYRLMMPTDLRTTDDYETPAVNKVAYTFLNRTPRELEQPSELLQSIRRETLEIKNEQRGMRFANMLAGGFAVKGLMQLLLSFPFCMATAILSNVGDPSRRFTAHFPRSKGRIVCGNLVLEEITGAPPLRRKTRATVSAFAYNRRLTLSVRCDPFTFTPADTREFLDLYAGRLHNHLAAPASAAPAPELAAV